MQHPRRSAPLPPFDVLHRDEHVLVVNKPSGISVHRGWDADPVNAVRVVRAMTGRQVHPVHRLDRATSGALVFAFDAATANSMQDHFRQRAIRKRYLALTRGVTPEEVHIDHAVPREPRGDRVDAVTRVRRLAVIEDRYSLVEAHPETGRLHQIRRHLKHINHPVVCDTRYGDGKVNRRFRDDFGLLRLALHAARVTFVHPHTGDDLCVIAPVPDDLAVPLERMGFAANAWAA